MRRIATFALLLLALTGCSSSDDDGSKPDGKASSSSSAGGPSKPTGPNCADIWKSGEKLPDDFTECQLDGRQARIDVTECTDGSRLIVADDIMWARTGDTIHRPKEAPLQDTEEYGAAYSDCTGE